jgi:hypothetical protein
MYRLCNLQSTVFVTFNEPFFCISSPPALRKKKSGLCVNPGPNWISPENPDRNPGKKYQIRVSSTTAGSWPDELVFSLFSMFRNPDTSWIFISVCPHPTCRSFGMFWLAEICHWCHIPQRGEDEPPRTAIPCTSSLARPTGRGYLQVTSITRTILEYTLVHWYTGSLLSTLYSTLVGRLLV